MQGSYKGITSLGYGMLTSQSKLISSLSPNCCTSNHACTVLLNKSIAASSADAPLPWW
jgi:hypothetical protein